eukprot:scaffold27184_cov45-Attheya_sp.AAC.4
MSSETAEAAEGASWLTLTAPELSPGDASPEPSPKPKSRPPPGPPPAAFEIANSESEPKPVAEKSPGYDNMEAGEAGEAAPYNGGGVVIDQYEDNDTLSSYERNLYSCLLGVSCICIMVLFVTAVLLGVQGIEDDELRRIEVEDELLVPLIETDDGTRIYSCPTVWEKAENDQGDALAHYKKDARALADVFYTAAAKDQTVVFEELTYDGYEETFDSKKEQSRAFKVKYFCSNLKSGEAIYESASGSGMNLLMTLEILKFECDIHNLVIGGNDYIEENVKNAIYVHSVLKPTLSQSSYFCVADSASSGTEHNHNPFAISGHVPAKTFNLVYTGYIEPMIDPIGMLDSDDMSYFERTTDIVNLLCDADTGFSQQQTWWAAQRVAFEYELAQEDWFAKWVHELIRIAKRSAPIIIENIPPRLCSHTEMHFSGVAKEFWATGVKKYGWDIDVNSIEIVDNPFPQPDRYNVFMRRNGALNVNDDTFID